MTAAASITHDTIDVASLISSVEAPAHGAVAIFLGTVREQNDERAVRGMRYEAYEEMALKTLEEIVSEAHARMGEGALSAVHRIGELAIGDVSVAIAAASPHRAPAFDAARFVIEQIKLRLPVWKHEHYIDGEAKWLEGSVPPMPNDATRVAR